MIFSYDLEKKVLSGILQHQHTWEEISSFLNESDFYSEDSKVNVSIFKLLKNARFYLLYRNYPIYNFTRSRNDQFNV